MGNFIDNIKLRLKQHDILVWIILINVCVFLILAISKLVTTLFMMQSFEIVQYLGVPVIPEWALHRQWTILTYMFTHEGVLHILFNMLMLYWFGQIFLSYFTPKNLGALYILGGIAGAFIFLLAFNTIPFYKEMSSSFLIGASASVMAVIFAVAFYKPQAEVGLLLIGRVKIVYIAIFLFIIDFISLTDKSNPGGHIAHIGGALTGILYARQYLKGRDITRWMNKIIDWFVNLTKPSAKKPKMKMKHNTATREADYDYNKRKHQQETDIDAILDKIKKSGYSSLSKEEKQKLFDASKK